MGATKTPMNADAQTEPSRELHATIYTDGACEPNPGPGGFGVVLLHPKKRIEDSGGFRLTTNNRMELLAAIRGLELLTKPCSVTLYSDSEYLVKSMDEGWVIRWKSKGWRRSDRAKVINVDLWERLLALCATYRVTFVWVKGHAGISENERCDALSCLALRQPDLARDEGYENKPVVPDLPKLTEAGQPCHKCSTPVIKQTAKAKRSRDYYYEFYLFCPSCKATYEVQAAKKKKDVPPSLF